MKVHEGAMHDHDDPFKEMVDDGDDDGAVDKLECGLNQFCEGRPDLAPENRFLMQMDSLILIER